MRIHFASSINLYLTLFVAASACQNHPCKVAMNDDKHGGITRTIDKTTSKDKTAQHDLRVLTDNLLDMDMKPKDESVQTSSTTSSPISTTDLTTTQILIDQNHDVLPASPTYKSVPEGASMRLAPLYSLEDHQAWFYTFTMIVDHGEDDQELRKVLEEGSTRQYLCKSISWGDDEYTPIHYAVQWGTLKAVKILVEDYKVSSDVAAGYYQKVPLHLAALRGRLELVEYLLKSGKDWKRLFDKDGAGVLQYATLGVYGEMNVEVVKHLVKQGADLKEKSQNFNLLYLAIEANNTNMIDYLLEQCPCLASEKVNGIDPSTYAINSGKREAASRIQNSVRDKV